MRRLAATAFLALLLVLAVPGTAAADEDNWSIPRYDLTASAAADGAVDVRLSFDFDFAGTEGHGPYVTLPLRQRIAGDPDHERAFTVTDVTAASPSGAPAQVETEEDGGALAIRVGDEDVEVDGVQSYEIGYRIRGVVNPATGTAGQDEIFWNVVGDAWEVPLSGVTVRLTGPAAVVGARCSAGQDGSDAACAAADVAGDTVTYRQDRVEPGTGLTVTAAWPAGTFVGAEPQLVPRRHLGNTFTLDPLTGGLAAALALVGAGALAAHARRRGRDQQYVGLTPGLGPVGAETAATVPRSRRAPVAVRFTPPDGVRPGELGTLLDEVAHTHHVTATVVDLAVRGHLRITETRAADGDGDGGTEVRSWRLVRTAERDRPVERLLPYEDLVLQRLFDGRSEVALDDLGPSFTGTVGKVQAALYAAVTDQGWFVANPATVRRRWYGIGAAVLLAGAALTLVLALTVGWGLVGLAVVLVGVLVLVVAHTMPARTAAGSAVLAQALGFKTYLETAEADQIRFEEGEDLFSRYLPHAIAFGVAERWAGVFAELAARGHDVPVPAWYVGPQPFAFAAVGGSSFADTLGAFSQAATTSMTAATAGTSGGSGMSSGFAGGGVGGGGGGGW
ncbi:Predicted membrane protein [Friedmanniella luteola]|uniref:Predicted membrane protein n=1 Tax=Friedmanniella luteola TaxID=546871 RepID=A0A1H1W4N6_9ACTN|nr:DUF2207 domain-containing protein [Friedmanniella luteola]SDS92107.1 Predicted membrane protein [Friedmanniella luteola]